MTYTGVGEGDSVLDIGCGPGSALARAREAGATVTGVDPTPGMVTRASQRVPDSVVVQGSAEFLDFEENSFTHVWSISAYHHWAYPETGLEQVLKVLKPGGKVFLAEHKLRRKKTGHGINAGAAGELADLLLMKGFVETSVGVMKARKKDYLVIEGTKPASTSPDTSSPPHQSGPEASSQ